MGTWTAAIIDTQGRPEFWRMVKAHGIEPVVEGIPDLALIECELGFDMEAPLRLAETISTALRTSAIGFSGQTASDAYEVRAYDRGDLARRLAYARDDGGWIAVDGRPQPWEPAFFFHGTTKGDASEWPDMLDDDLSEIDRARYEAASAAGDASKAMSILRPRSNAPLRRLCAFYGVDPDAPAGKWSRPSFFSRLFR